MFSFYYDFHIYILIYPDTCRKLFVVTVTFKCEKMDYAVLFCVLFEHLRMDLFYVPFVTGTKTKLF